MKDDSSAVKHTSTKESVCYRNVSSFLYRINPLSGDPYFPAKSLCLLNTPISISAGYNFIYINGVFSFQPYIRNRILIPVVRNGVFTKNKPIYWVDVDSENQKSPKGKTQHLEVRHPDQLYSYHFYYYPNFNDVKQLEVHFPAELNVELYVKYWSDNGGHTLSVEYDLDRIPKAKSFEAVMENTKYSANLDVDKSSELLKRLKSLQEQRNSDDPQQVQAKSDRFWCSVCLNWFSGSFMHAH